MSEIVKSIEIMTWQELTDAFARLLLSMPYERPVMMRWPMMVRDTHNGVWIPNRCAVRDAIIYRCRQHHNI